MGRFNKGPVSWFFVLWAASAALTGCAAKVADETREVLSYDGLVPLEDTLMTQVWVREGYSLAGYDKVMLVGADIQYRPIRKQSSDADSIALTAFPVTEAKKREFEQLITEEFDRALERLTLEEVSAPGPDVLLVRGMMLDVVSRVPPGSASGAEQALDSVGQATFVVELIDSESNSVLVRALDTRSAKTPGQTTSDAASNRAEVRRLISRWADMLVDALNDLTAIDELQGA